MADSVRVQAPSSRDPKHGAIDPSLASIDATSVRSQAADNAASIRSLDRLPHRLQTAHDAAESESLSRQTSNTDSQATTSTTPAHDTVAAPSGRSRLPSISELIANGGESRHFSHTSTSPSSTSHIRQHQYSHHRPTRSVGSTGHHSPLLAGHPPNGTTQMSPTSYAAYPAFSPNMTARSPTSAAAEGPYYGAPQYYTPSTSLQHRRPSAVSDRGLALPPSLNSASSSVDSGGAASSSVDGYSTSNTTPIDPAQAVDTTPRPTTMLPPPPAMMLGGFRCTYEGCNAPPFQTQYLLTSHKNVHSQNRPHYCPVKNCSRAEGGKGFKRKNEMIRHGLVHNSPGYICPFCPEREHKYPRPDNLQRHVRVHHVDKDRDDPALQEVLNQRTEGQGKTRRRRTLTESPTAAAA